MLSQHLTAEDRKTLEIKYKSKRISELTEVELLLHAQALLLKIHVITGWRITENEALLNILQDQFNKKLLEDYGNCNIDEIEFAFRHFGTHIKDWGKNMNLALIDEAVNEYLSERRRLSEMEESLAKPQQLNYKPINYDPCEFVDMYYQDFLQQKLNTQLVSSRAFEIAVEHCGLTIREDQFETYLNKAKTEILISNDYSKSDYSFDVIVENRAMVLCLVDWFTIKKSKGITQISKELKRKVS